MRTTGKLKQAKILCDVTGDIYRMYFERAVATMPSGISEGNFSLFHEKRASKEKPQGNRK